MHFNIYDIFYSQSFHHVLAGMLAFFRVMLLLKENKCTNMVVTCSLHNN
jgi:hypothetical protein